MSKLILSPRDFKKIQNNVINAQEWLDQNYPKENRQKQKVLDISNTNIDSGLEHLPNSIQFFFCKGVNAIFDELKQKGCIINEESGLYDLRKKEKVTYITIKERF